ncbi:MAG: aminotransferase class IV [Flavobacteriaceae bacterium]|nr:aminotransferase class IV [Flavobacteriaceae bacterium]
MINYNGQIIPKANASISLNNRGFKYGDSVFETIKVKNKKVYFAEDHYFRLMASARMLRMNVPMNFTLEYFESEILKLAAAIGLANARVRFSIFRKEGGLYSPLTNDSDFLIEASELDETIKEDYEVELFKDHYVYSGLLSTLKSNNKILNVIASIFKTENGYDNCLLLNEKKQLVEAINGNLFLVKGSTILTPAMTEGCIKGIIRKKLLEILKKDPDFDIRETEISPFELQKADEVFITNAIVGIQPVTKYRRKIYTTEVSEKLRKKLNALALLA